MELRTWEEWGDISLEFGVWSPELEWKDKYLILFVKNQRGFFLLGDLFYVCFIIMTILSNSNNWWWQLKN